MSKPSGRDQQRVSAADISRACAVALRHDPARYGLDLDAHGWVPVTALVEALRSRHGWPGLSAGDVDEMVRTQTKRRYEIGDDRIRAMYGHSLPGRIAHVASTPPDVLFHGTSPAAAEAILTDGLRPMTRQYVHLSADRPTAYAVGLRKAALPVMLRVDARAACGAGVVFRPGNEAIWLADAVPAAFIARDED